MLDFCSARFLNIERSIFIPDPIYSPPGRNVSGHLAGPSKVSGHKNTKGHGNHIREPNMGNTSSWRPRGSNKPEY